MRAVAILRAVVWLRIDMRLLKVSHMKNTRYDDGRNVIGQRQVSVK
jgi:hypothetical protein